EILKIELLKKHGLLDRSPGYGSFLVERAVDLATVLFLGCVSVLTTFDILPNRVYAYSLIAFIIVASTAGVYLLHRLHLDGSAQATIQAMRECIGDVRGFILIVLITATSWSALAVGWQFCLAAAAIHLSFGQAIAFMSIVALINVLSLIPGGLGVSEAGGARLLMRLGSPEASAQAGVIVLRSYTVIALVLGVLHFGLWTLVRRRRLRNAEAVRPPLSSQHWLTE
ncbi:MAG TPA: lysylphosphatidylglycerol synthase transmembrane domain-containing protein, partial [Nitrolancea sp.]|nr:lysylphosphatidylglycerol synthase transmembrane domain-containing protein [Nitrolancea sp.]